ncbi:hypothetical protein G7072_13370 [Nocardioides sp. HDW12B]|uniref:hypothetical protein n=1 Tax=Nocardioides sp. HDW12B TaxID=2714939 RepID=UPI0014079476|nr:hypothetical protein [Nocardioides sp. HDW12B]QIK67202.1 hypothetical protein G7072_13370 [Nocardioides sp. HDW12B]
MHRRPAAARLAASPAAPLAAALLVVGALAGCGEQSSPDPTGAAGDVPVTPQALAWVVSEQLGAPGSAEGTDQLRDLGEGTVATSVRFGSARRGHSLVLGVSPDAPTGYLDCSSGENFFDDCQEVADGVTLAWQEEEPEEDPGVVYLFATKGDTTVAVYQSSTPITGDPREVDLPVSVEAMVELAQDPRVDLTTSQEAVDAGASLDFWRGGYAPGPTETEDAG